MYVSKFDKIYRQIINEWNTGIYTQQEQKSDIPQEIKSAVGNNDQLWYIKGLNENKNQICSRLALDGILFNPIYYKLKEQPKTHRSISMKFDESWVKPLNTNFIDQDILIIPIPNLYLKDKQKYNNIKTIKSEINHLMKKLNIKDIYFYSKVTGKITL